MIDDQSTVPIYHQVAEAIEDMILRGQLREEEQVPSTNQLAKYYQLNPATARKGLNQLVDKGYLYKKRGVGMFVSQGSLTRLKEERKQAFFDNYWLPLVAEAFKLEISRQEILEWVANLPEETVNKKKSTNLKEGNKWTERTEAGGEQR